MNDRLTKKKARTTYPVHDAIAHRWSGRAFSEEMPNREIIGSLFEAARWAPSSFNEQPWHFFIATKDQEAEYDTLFNLLSVRNQEWAGLAPVLALSVAKTYFDKNDKENRHAWHDVGLAAENLVLQATFHGLVVHQMAGFDVEASKSELEIPDGFDPIAAFAIGYPGDTSKLSQTFRKSEENARKRKALGEFLFLGQWGNTAVDDILTASEEMKIDAE